MTADKLKHLEFIQNVITRMNTNSFQIKGWTITLVSATLALYASTKNEWFILVGVFPAVIFWCLDAYYLTQERKFRGLYKDVAGISDEPQKLKPFEMNPALYVGPEYSYGEVFCSPTILRFYLLIIIMLLGMAYYLIRT